MGFNYYFKRLKGKISRDGSSSKRAQDQGDQITTGTVIAEDGRSRSVINRDAAQQTLNQSLDPQTGTVSPQQREPSPTIQPKDVPIRELWSVAYEQLREEDAKLVTEYERKLEGDMVAGFGSITGIDLGVRERMHAILENKMKEVNKNVWKLRFGSSQVEVKDIVQPILGVVGLANEYIADAVKASPYASLGWAGVSLLLPLFTNPSVQASSMAKGLAFVSSLISQSRRREELYLRHYESVASNGKQVEGFPQSHREYKTCLVDLYCEILKFQATSYCYFANRSAFRLGLDAVRWNDWDGMIENIRQKETAFHRLMDIWRDMRYDEECKIAEGQHQEIMKSWCLLSADFSDLSKEIRNAQSDRNRRDFLQWLCAIDHTQIYNSARGSHKAGTGEWLVKNWVFETWEKDDASFLWLHGKAGSGKSVLSSTVIKHLETRYSSDVFTALAYFYFSFSDSEKQNVDGMLASLIKQIVACRPDTPASVQSLEKYKDQGGRPDTESLEKALLSCMQGFSAVYIIIDALDECPTIADQRDKLLASLERVVELAPDNCHILCTSRKERDIEKSIRPTLSIESRAEIDLSLHSTAVNEDIEKFIDSTLGAHAYDSWPDDIKSECKSSLVEKADGMFQYIRCQLQMLQKLSNVTLIREALRNLPNGLDETYNRILQNIDPAFKPQVMTSLKWLAFSRRPLKIVELAEIFVLADNEDDFNEMDSLFTENDVLQYFPGLLVIDRVGSAERRQWHAYDQYHDDTLLSNGATWRVARLAHFSIQEYLTSDRISQGPVSEFSFSEVDAHVSIAQSCLSYHLHVSTTFFEDTMKEYHLRSYSRGWPEHLEMIPGRLWTSKIFRNAALALTFNSQSLFNLTNQNITLRLYMKDDRPYHYTAYKGYRQLTEMLVAGAKYMTQDDINIGLERAVEGGNVHIVKLFAGMGASISGFQGGLVPAASEGETAIVEFLLDGGADINTHCNNLRKCSALQAATRGFHADTMELLLRRGAKFNSCEGEAPFFTRYLPVDSTLRKCIQVLLNHSSDVDMLRSDEFGTLFYMATLGGDEVFDLVSPYCAYIKKPFFAILWPSKVEIRRVQKLLDCGADLTTQGIIAELCATPVFEENPQAMKLLVDKGADVNATNGRGKTALEVACGGQTPSTAVVALLLDLGADPNAMADTDPDGNVRVKDTALRRASSSANVDVVRLLIESGADVNAVSALHCAARTGNMDVLRLLIESGADVNAVSEDIGTALHCAAREGNMDVLRLLIESGADPNAVCKEGTALYSAYIAGNMDAARLLIESGADPNAWGGMRNALYSASGRGNTDVVRSLIESGADANASFADGATALQIASLKGKTDVVRLLIECGADVNARGGEYETALQAACWRNHCEIVKLLIDSGADVNIEGGKCGTALRAACAHDGGTYEIAFLLLDRGADVRLQATAIWHTISDSNTWYAIALLKKLLDGGFDVDDPNGPYGTALNAALLRPRDSWGWDTWHERASMLLKRGADVNLVTGEYGTALQAACSIASKFIGHRWPVSTQHDARKAKLLLENRPEIDVNQPGGPFGSALQAAAYAGQLESVRLLLSKGARVNTHPRRGKYGSALDAAIVKGFWDVVQLLLDAGATADCRGSDKEFMEMVRKEDGQRAVERYEKFWEVETRERQQAKEKMVEQENHVDHQHS